jgi:hypothetical protein
MEPVAGHLSAAGRTLPGHPVRPQDDLAAQDRMPEAADGQSADRSERTLSLGIEGTWQRVVVTRA